MRIVITVSAILFVASVLLGVTEAHCLQDVNRGQTARKNDTSSTEPRVALVIGNGAYKDSPLNNPINDARDVADALTGFGFAVTHGNNQSLEEMKKAIRAFGLKLRNGGVGLFYFAGHGMQVKGHNYLLPVGANINDEAEIEFEAVDVGFVLAQLEAAQNRLNIVILDACRNNPFARSFRSAERGLASIDAPTGTLIAYATAPGKTASDGSGRNGLYTQELLVSMRTPSLKIEDVFKRVRTSVRTKSATQQVPWESSSLEGDFYFVTSTSETSNPLPVGMSSEDTDWRDVAARGTAADYQDYIRRYPTGKYASEAQKRIQMLSNIQTPPASNSDAGKRWEQIDEKNFTVPGNAAWTSTSLQVSAGQQVKISGASKQIDLGANGFAGPEGTNKDDSQRPLRDCQTGSLIGRVGEQTICLGREGTFTATASGILYLGINEGRTTDNKGSFIVNIRQYQLK